MLVICTNMLKLHFKGRRVLQSHDEIFFRSQSFKLLKIYPHFFRQAYNKMFAYTQGYTVPLSGSSNRENPECYFRHNIDEYIQRSREL